MSLDQQIECVSRELRMRRRVYPRLVREGKMRDTDANREILAMQAVWDTLTGMRPGLFSQDAGLELPKTPY